MERNRSDEWIHAKEGDDKLNGQKGFDTIHGGDGHDTIRGGDGKDHLTGNKELIIFTDIAGMTALEEANKTTNFVVEEEGQPSRP